MKGLGLLVAAVVATTGIAATPAAAQPERVRVVETTKVRYTHDDRGWRGDRWRGDRGHHYGWRNKWRWRTKCWTQWRNGHRERVCRRIRYR